MKILSDIIKDIERDIATYGDIKVHYFKIRTEEYTTSFFVIDKDGKRIDYRDWTKSIKFKIDE